MAGCSSERKATCGLRSLAASALLISVLAGCTQMSDSDRQKLIEANDLYARNQIAPAVARLDQLIEDYPKAPEVAEAHYLRGLCRTQASDIHHSPFPDGIEP